MAYALVQKTNATTTASVTSAPLAFTSPPTAGNLIVGIGAVFAAGLTCTASDSQVNSFTNLGGYSSVNFGATLFNFAAIAGASAADTITIAWGGASEPGYSLYIAEFSGAGASVSEDGAVVSAEQNSQVTTVTTPSFTPTASGSLLLNVIGASGITSAGGSWTLGVSDTNGNGWLWQVAPSTSAVAASATIPSSAYVGTIVGIKAPPPAIPLPARVVSQAVTRSLTY